MSAAIFWGSLLGGAWSALLWSSTSCRVVRAGRTILRPRLHMAVFILAGTLWGGAAAAAEGFTADVLRTVFAVIALLATAYADWLVRLIPNKVSAACFSAGLLVSLFEGAASLAEHSMASLVAAAALLALRGAGQKWFGEPGMGMGDVKIAAAMGMLLGWNALWVLYLAVCLAGLLGLVGMLAGTLPRRARLPFAPFFAAALFLSFAVPWPFVQ